MTKPGKITREVIENYALCKTKGFLKLTGEQGAKSDFQEWRRKIIEQQKINVAANFISHFRGSDIREDIVLTPPNMSKAPDTILRANFESELISLSLDALVKDKQSTTRQSVHSYVPVLFTDGKISMTQKVLLGVLALIVSELQDKEPTTGLVFHEGGKPSTVRFADGLKAARTMLSEIKTLQQGSYSPMLVLNSHCQVCEFRARCHTLALKEDNLSLLRGMNEGQIIRLNAKGIFSVRQLSYTFRSRRRPKRAKKSSPVHDLPLRALALREKKIFVHGNREFKLSDTRVYLDFEGTPQTSAYYLIGMHILSGGQESRETYWADTASEPDQSEIFANLLAHLSQYPDYSILHFGNYEIVALQRMKSRMGEPYSAQIENVLKHCVNVLGIITGYIYFPTYSNSLKEIGAFLGHRWSDPSSSGAQTLVWRARWLSDHDTSSKTRLVQYNNEDCAALKGIVEFLEQVFASGPTSPFRDHQGAEIVRTSGLAAQKEGWPLFGATNYVLEEFREINKLSYFDYQRDRVFTRTAPHRTKATVRKKRTQPKPNETVTYRAAICPTCKSRRIKPLSETAYEVADLRFTRGGVKRWVTRSVQLRYSCIECGTRFLPVANRSRRNPPKYGRGLIGWCMYQLLIGGQNLNRIHRSLTDLFGLSIPKGSVYRFKRAVAAYFRVGYENILNDLLSGDLINVDETTINLQKDKGYVWVLASTSSVYFFYRRSREGSFLTDMLCKFRGVLVSDFFAAYDALDVAQQRCLIHLMRDMNEDLLKHPFDDQLKSIAAKFSSLLKCIVGTIDRYGLKRRHLNKHSVSATRFCDWVIGQNFTSEVAKNYVKRITKYRDYLFTFLSHDGIPWNNNNAEHAIKSASSLFGVGGNDRSCLSTDVFRFG